MRIYINNFNRLESLRKMCEILNRFEIIIIDNGSTYPPLLEWYKTVPYRIIRTVNHGRLALWKTREYASFSDQYFVLTDSDLDLSLIPNDWHKVLMAGLEHQFVVKSGFSIFLNDLPDTEMASKVKSIEGNYYKDRLHTGHYLAPIDTTFAIYDRKRLDMFRLDFDAEDIGIQSFFYSAVRAPYPYSVRHLPWYLTKENLTEEDKYYINTAKPYSWLSQLKQL